MAPLARDPIEPWVTILPGGVIEGEMCVPGSKSMAQRQLLAAFLAAGRTRIQGLPEGQDVQALLGALRVLAGSDWGRDGTFQGGAWGSQPRGAGERVLSVGESGTAARLLTACLALGGSSQGPLRLVPEGSLRTRSSQALLEALEQAGARASSSGQGGASWPLSIEPVDCPENLILRNPRSSQEVSGLLFALAARGAGTLTIHGSIPSAPYVRMTRCVLAEFGVRVEERGRCLEVNGELRAPAHAIQVEPDASSAAVALAAGCLGGGTVRVRGLGSNSAQGDVRILEYLRAFGCSASEDADGFVASGAPCRGATLDLRGEPDLAPILAVLGAMACVNSGQATRLEGLGTLDDKESPRLTGLARVLDQLGWQVNTGRDWLAVEGAPLRPPEQPLPRPLDPAGDHRMAFAFALLGLSFTGVRILGPECVRKSYPNFWEHLARLGARISN
jgi:3-phosphoshikimate 1-carboxyvinyltransferase